MTNTDLPHLRLDLSALRGPRSISGLTYVIASAGLFLSSFEFELVLPQSTLADAFVIALAATLASVLILLLADKTVLRHRREYPQSIALVLAVYIACGVVRAVVSSVSAAAVDANGPELVARSFAGVVLVVAWLSIIAILLDYIDRDRETTRGLRERQAQLAQQRDYERHALAQGRASIAALVDSVAGPAIESSEDLVARIGSSQFADATEQSAQLSALATKIRDQAEGQVRELSHLLHAPEAQYSESDLVAPKVQSKAESDSRWIGRTLRQASAIDPIQPTAVTLTVLVEAIPLFTYLFGFRGLFQCAVIGTAVTFGFLTVARRVLTPQLLHWPQAARLALLLVVALLAGGLGTASIYFWYPPERDEVIAIFIRSSWVFVIAIAVWAAIASSAAQSQRAQRNIAATNAELQWEVELLNDELARFQRSAGEVIHGRVQGRIVAAALTLSLEAKRLREASRVDSGLTRTALTDAIAILGEARDDVRAIQNEDGTGREVSIAELLAAVAAAWKGVVAVDIIISESATARINASDQLRARAAEAVREAVSNAARHGAARSVSVELSLAGPSLIIVANDDGIGAKVDVEAGVGLSQFAAAGGAWQLVSERGRGATLTVALPIGLEVDREPLTGPPQLR